MHIENIVIGKPLLHPKEFFALDESDWINNEKNKTIYTEERFLPRILVDLGFTKSTSEVRRNKKELFITLGKLDFLEVKWGKKKCHILVGE